MYKIDGMGRGEGSKNPSLGNFQNKNLEDFYFFSDSDQLHFLKSLILLLLFLFQFEVFREIDKKSLKNILFKKKKLIFLQLFLLHFLQMFFKKDSWKSIYFKSNLSVLHLKFTKHSL